MFFHMALCQKRLSHSFSTTTNKLVLFLCSWHGERPWKAQSDSPLLCPPSCPSESTLQTAVTPRPTENETQTSSISTQTNSISGNCSCPGTAPSLAPSSPDIALGLLKVTLMSECKGDVELQLYHHSSSVSSSLPVCHESETDIIRFLTNVCQNKQGCYGMPRWSIGKHVVRGYLITAHRAEEKHNCLSMRVQCSGKSTEKLNGYGGTERLNSLVI